MAEFTLEQKQAMAMASAKRKRAEAEQSTTPEQAAAEQAPNPADGMSTWDKVITGAGKAFDDTKLGAQQISGKMSEGVLGTMAGLFPDTDLGQESFDRAMDIRGQTAGMYQESADRKRRDAPLLDTKAGIGGNIAGNVALTLPAGLAAPAQTLAGAATLGGMFGASQPVTDESDRLVNSLVGGAGGAGGQMIASSLARALNPQTSKGALALLNDGVDLTPGQVLGGTFKTVEEKARSLPIMGDMIRHAQNKTIESFNKATLNKVIAPIGKTVSKIGHEGLDEVEGIISKQFDDVVGSIKAIRLDDDLAKDLDKILNLSKNLPAEKAKLVQQIIDDEILGKFVGDGRMSPTTFKEIDTILRQEASSLIKNQDPFFKKAGYAIKEAQESMLNMLERLNPGKKADLQAVKMAYANFMNAEKAAISSGAETAGGVFTPSQLSQAIKSGSNNRAFRRGNLPLQDISRNAKGVVTSTIPDSGTAERLMLGGVTAGGLASVSPMTLGALLLGTAGYTKPAMHMANALLAKRPELMREAGRQVKSLVPYSAAIGAGVSNP